MAQYDAQLELMTGILAQNGYDDYKIRGIVNSCLNDPRVCLYNEIRKNNMQVDAADQQTITDIGRELNSGFTTSRGTTDEDAPTPPRDAQPSAPTPQDEPSSARQGSLDRIQGPAETVKVRQGMTIAAIARAFNDQNNMGGDLKEFEREIMQMNNITDPSRLQVGQVLQIPYSMGTGRDGASRGLPPGGFTNYESQIENAFEELMGQFSESNDCDETCPKSCPDCGGTGDPEKYQAMKAKESEMGSEKPQTPLSEFILSYFDYTTGQFPKGETAILTMVEKDYGERYINPAKQFIEKINNKVAEVMGYKEEPEVVVQDNSELDSIRSLAGL